MFSKAIMGSGAILIAILISLTTLLAWPNYLQYIWALITAILGIFIFIEK